MGVAGQRRAARSRWARAFATAALLATPLAALGIGSAPARAATVRVGGTVVQVSSTTGLINQQTVWVTGTGFAPGTAGRIVECNLDTGQPTVTLGPDRLPVGCTAPGASTFSVAADGTVDVRYFRISTGNLGALQSGLDSNGTSAAADAAAYPCPPTPAQQAAGISCGITVSDGGGNAVTVPISLIGPGTPASGGYSFPPPVYQTVTLPPTSTPPPLPDPVPPPAATSVTQGVVATVGAPAATSSLPYTGAPSTLAYTGAGRGLWLIGAAGVVLLFLGYLLLTIYRRPRQLLADTGRSVARAFGAGPTTR